MGSADKARNKVQDLKGRAKETTGRATGNANLVTKGKTDRVEAAAKDAGEKIKDLGTRAKRVVQS